jgi:hypothetical protein
VILPPANGEPVGLMDTLGENAETLERGGEQLVRRLAGGLPVQPASGPRNGSTPMNLLMP